MNQSDENEKAADLIESEEFYNLMQNYRHAPITQLQSTVDAYEAVKVHINNKLEHGKPRWVSANMSSIPPVGTRIYAQYKFTKYEHWVVNDLEGPDDIGRYWLTDIYDDKVYWDEVFKYMILPPPEAK